MLSIQLFGESEAKQLESLWIEYHQIEEQIAKFRDEKRRITNEITRLENDREITRRVGNSGGSIG
jgi:predicted  nucleic acid-binding Zn-ribbon protein